LLQAFMGVTAVMTLALAAVVSERKRAEEQLRHLAVSDALTGQGNYRQRITVLEGDIYRSQRTERPLAILLLDPDGLKTINDRYGHLIGNRALCRVADALRSSCRARDGATAEALLGAADHALYEAKARCGAARRSAPAPSEDDLIRPEARAAH
jgi:GGDEF domain-containing protein